MSPFPPQFITIYWQFYISLFVFIALWLFLVRSLLAYALTSFILLEAFIWNIGNYYGEGIFVYLFILVMIIFMGFYIAAISYRRKQEKIPRYPYLGMGSRIRFVIAMVCVALFITGTSLMIWASFIFNDNLVIDNISAFFPTLAVLSIIALMLLIKVGKRDAKKG